MLGSIIRNYKNAGVAVTLKLHLADSKVAFDRTLRPVVVHNGTGLELHNLAGAAHRELLRQAMASALPRRSGAKFEDEAWRVAAYAIQQEEAELMMVGAKNLPTVVPYACFLAEYLSKSFADREERLVCIARTGEVWLESKRGSTTEAKDLGNFKT
jgi:hypothetical protein